MQAEVDPGHLGQAELHVRQSADEGSNWAGGAGGLEDGCGHLVEERSEDVVVVPIHEGDLDAGPLAGAIAQDPDGGQAAEAAPHDHDTGRPTVSVPGEGGGHLPDSGQIPAALA